MSRTTAEAGVASAIEEGDDFLKSGDGVLSDVRVIDVIRRLVARHNSDQVLHALQALSCCFLYRDLVVHLTKPHRVHRHF